MFSEALHILDQNTVQYMIDDLKRQLEEALKMKEEALDREKDSRKSLQDKELMIASLKQQLEEKNRL